MMHYLKKISFSMMLFLIAAACNKQRIAPGTPESIRKKIRDFDETAACPEGASAKLYLFRGRHVYTLDPGQCGADLQIEVISDGQKGYDYETLGYLGGIAGNSIIEGVDFYTNAVYQSTVWEE